VATDVFPVGAGTYAVEVDLQVSLLSDVAPHVGDVFLGMATGLAGAPIATVEGLAINVVDASGARGSVWINGRDGDGSGAGDPQLNPDDAHQAGVSFPNLTGGPALSTSENGATTRAPARP
jgi:hypothetical protein